MDTTNTDQSAASNGAVPPALQTLLENIETLLPSSKETSVTTVVLYLDNKGDERLIITGLRFPSGDLGQLRFDYRAPEGSKLMDLDLSDNTMQGYDMNQNPDDAVSRHTLDVASTAEWLVGLIGRGSVERV